MFTGLIEEIGVVLGLERGGEGGRLSIRARKVLDGTGLGDSVAVNGACLTVVDVFAGSFVVDCIPETLSVTTLGGVTKGCPVNLERALALGARLGGHLVLGHVDAVARLLAIGQRGVSRELRFSLPGQMRAYVAPKGSVAIDGISLTVARVDEDGFEVGVIPHTLKETTLGTMTVGTRVNLEADVLARYVQRVLESGRGEAAGSPEATGGLTLEFLERQGFA
jgi:riboflavin synthase